MSQETILTVQVVYAMFAASAIALFASMLIEGVPRDLKEASGPPAGVDWKKLFLFALPPTALASVGFLLIPLRVPADPIVFISSLSTIQLGWYAVNFVFLVVWLTAGFVWIERQRPSWEEHERQKHGLDWEDTPE